MKPVHAWGDPRRKVTNRKWKILIQSKKVSLERQISRTTETGKMLPSPPYQIFRLRFHRFRNRFGWIVGIYDVFNRWHKTRFVHVPSIIIVSVYRHVSGIFGPHEVGDIGRPTTGTGIVMTHEQTIIVFMVIEVLTFRHFFHSIPPLRSIPP